MEKRIKEAIAEIKSWRDGAESSPVMSLSESTWSEICYDRVAKYLEKQLLDVEVKP